MMDGPKSLLERAARTMGDPEALDLLSNLVSIAPTNLEDPAHQRWEKPNYERAMDRILRTARGLGFATRVYDPTSDPHFLGKLHGGPRPNAIIDRNVGADHTVLVMAHYDVVPVPEEQRSRWKSPPFTLTAREDGRLYGRGSNDDLGSGVVGGLTAFKRLAREEFESVNLRLLICCDEETGGEGGIETIREHDARLGPDDPGRIIRADVALIPDGSPHTTAGSSGVAFLDATVERPVPLVEATAYGEELVRLHELARTWKSPMRSEDWPAHNAPEPTITGRATLTKFDLRSAPSGGPLPRLLLAHAESDAANQIAQSVTLAFEAPGSTRTELPKQLATLLEPPFHLEAVTSSGESLPTGSLVLAIVGVGGHGGYPHRFSNPVPPTLQLLRIAAERGWIDARAEGDVSAVVDLRLTPEMELNDGVTAASGRIGPWLKAKLPVGRVVAPPGRSRSGYALPVDHPSVLRMATIMDAVFHEPVIYGEYGGTDASSLRGLSTPAGEPLPALVIGSMDRAANIHEAEESLDPKYFAGIVDVICRYVQAM
ncbi:MAG: M20/M25/M40 family metallo-hydrolase [Thermoplasmata archaeon]